MTLPSSTLACDYNEQDILDLEEEVSILKNDYKTVKDSLEQTKKEHLSDVHNKNVEIDELNKKFRFEKRKLQDELEVQTNINEKNQKKIISYEKEMAELKKKVYNLEHKSKSTKKNTNHTFEVLKQDNLEKRRGLSLEYILAEIKRISEESEDLKIKSIALTSAKESMLDEIQELKMEMKEHKDDSEFRKERLKQIKNEKQDLIEEREESEEKITELENANAALSKTVSDLNTQISIKQEDLEMCLERERKLRLQNRDLNDNIDHLNEKTVSRTAFESLKYEKTNAEIASKQESLQKERVLAKFAKLEKEFENYQNEMNSKVKRYTAIEGRLGQLERTNNDIKDSGKQYEREIEKRKKRETELEIENETLQLNVNAMKIEVQKSQYRIEMLLEGLKNSSEASESDYSD